MKHIKITAGTVLACVACSQSAVDQPTSTTEASAVNLGAIDEALSESGRPETVEGRQALVDYHIQKWHDSRGHKIIRTVVDEDGSVVDLVDADTVPGSRAEPPPLPVDRREKPEESVAPTTYREGAGDPNIVRYVRPLFSAWVSGNDQSSSLDEFIRKASRTHGTPEAGSERLYAGVSYSEADMTGADSTVNMRFSGADVPGSDNFFLAQTAVIDLGSSGRSDDQFIGWILGRNPYIYDSLARILTEFYVSGFEEEDVGDYEGGWSGCASEACVLGFIPAAGAAHAVGDQVSGLSVIDGAQYAHRMLVQRDDNCSQDQCVSSYWLLYDSTWVGHYEIGTADNIRLFKLKDGFPVALWYGEVFDNSEQGWTNTDMTSGLFPNATGASWRKTGYFAKIGKQVGTGQPWSDVPSLTFGGGDDSDCYRGTIRMSPDPTWSSTLWFGGPGGNNTAATCDPY